MGQPEIKITTRDDGADFLFVSYKSQNRAQMEEIVSILQQRFGLRVYYDKKFEVENSPWLTLMPQQLSSDHCKGMLVFGSSQYICSYACLMELLYFKTSKTTDKRDRPKPIIPLVLDPVKRQIQVLEEDEDLLDSVSMLATEADFIRDSIINSIRKYRRHLLKDEILCTSIDAFLELLDDIESRLDNRSSPTATNEIKPAFVAECIKRFFQLQGENSNYFTGDDHFYTQLYQTILNQKVCGSSVFEPLVPSQAPEAVRPAATFESAPPPSVKRGPGRPRKTEARPAPAVPVQAVEKPAPAAAEEAPHDVSMERPAEAPLSRFAGAVRPDTTVGQFRALVSDPDFCRVLGQLRRDGSLFPRQRGIFDYAMLAVLGGCNAMTHPYQQNYYDCAVANAEKKLEWAKRTADWTWSSNARKVVGLEKSGRLDAPYNDPFEVLDEGTTLAQLQAAFRAGASTEYRTRDNEAVARVFDVLYAKLG